MHFAPNRRKGRGHHCYGDGLHSSHSRWLAARGDSSWADGRRRAASYGSEVTREFGTEDNVRTAALGCQLALRLHRTFFSPLAYHIQEEVYPMVAFLLWCFLFVVCWPLALLALILYPIVWLLLLPFRLVGIAVHGALALVWAVVMLPARLLSAPFRLSRI